MTSFILMACLIESECPAPHEVVNASGCIQTGALNLSHNLFEGIVSEGQGGGTVRADVLTANDCCFKNCHVIDAPGGAIRAPICHLTRIVGQNTSALTGGFLCGEQWDRVDQPTELTLCQIAQAQAAWSGGAALITIEGYGSFSLVNFTECLARADDNCGLGHAIYGVAYDGSTIEHCMFLDCVCDPAADSTGSISINIGTTDPHIEITSSMFINCAIFEINGGSEPSLFSACYFIGPVSWSSSGAPVFSGCYFDGPAPDNIVTSDPCHTDALFPTMTPFDAAMVQELCVVQVQPSVPIASEAMVRSQALASEPIDSSRTFRDTETYIVVFASTLTVTESVPPHRLSTGAIIGILFGLLALIALMIVILCLLLRRSDEVHVEEETREKTVTAQPVDYFEPEPITE